MSLGLSYIPGGGTRVVVVRVNHKYVISNQFSFYCPKWAERERTYVSRYLCSPVTMFPEPMFPGTYVPRYLCSPVPMFPGFCTLIVVISINRLQILPTPWYDSRLWLCLGFRFMVLVRVRVRVRLELQTVFRLWLGCGLGLCLYG